MVITRIDYATCDRTRFAVIERNDSGEREGWDVTLTGVTYRTDQAPRCDDESHHAHRLTTAQQIARVWCDSGRRP